MGQFFKSVCGLTAAAVLTASFAASADAGSRYGEGSDEGVYRYVTARATTGGETVTAPVRHGRWGDEVRTPGGNWVDCEVTCEYTLRRLTVDFWQGQTDKFVSPGYFTYEFDLDTGEKRRTGPRFLGRF